MLIINFLISVPGFSDFFLAPASFKTDIFPKKSCNFHCMVRSFPLFSWEF
jgi:hypothetical protein